MIKKDPNDVNSHANNWLYTRSARIAFETLLRSVKWDPDKSLLIPAYIGYTEREGSGVFDPVRTTRTPYTFYPLGERLEVDMRTIGSLLATGRFPMMLVIHYFGLPHVDMEELAAACAAHGTLLIEDCAHVPGPVQGSGLLGSYGAAAIYSLHKILAVQDGGVLRINEPLLAHIKVREHDRCAASVLEQVLRTDLVAVMETRRRNYGWLADKLQSVEGLEVLYPGIGMSVPHNFPVRIEGGLREKLYFALLEKNFPTIALYYKMIDQIEASEFPLSHELARSILNLPVHQDTTLHDLGQLCDALTAELYNLRR